MTTLQQQSLSDTRAALVAVRCRLHERDAALFVALAGGAGCAVTIQGEITALRAELHGWQRRYQEGMEWVRFEADVMAGAMKIWRVEG